MPNIQFRPLPTGPVSVTVTTPPRYFGAVWPDGSYLESPEAHGKRQDDVERVEKASGHLPWLFPSQDDGERQVAQWVAAKPERSFDGLTVRPVDEIAVTY